MFVDFGIDTVSQFTNDIAGVIKGSQTDGQVYAENDGTGSVNGWSALKNRITNVETATEDVQEQLEEKADASDLENYVDLTSEQKITAKKSFVSSATATRNYTVSEITPAGTAFFGRQRTSSVKEGLYIDGYSQYISFYFENGAEQQGNVNLAWITSSWGSSDYTIQIYPYSGSWDLGRSGDRFRAIYANTINAITITDGTNSATPEQIAKNLLSIIAITDNSITQLSYNKVSKITLSADRTFTFESTPSITGTNLSYIPEYKAVITTTAAVDITLPTGTYKFKTDDSTKASMEDNVISLATGTEYDIVIRDGKVICWVW